VDVNIKFGTDGWRGVIAEDFTFDNLRMAAQAVADYLEDKGESKQVAVGYDRRFLSEDFAAAAAEVFAGNGLTVYLSPKACATPHVSYFVNRRNLPVGVMITASHNPYKYNGFKIKERFGGSASVDTTKQIEALLGRNPVRTMSFREAKKISRIIETPLDEAYGELIESLVDIEAVRHSHLSVVIDSMNGVGEKLLEHWVGSRTCRVSTLRSDRDVLFAGRAPEPKEAYLDVLRQAVVSSNADLGLATDGDGDRSGGVHADGSIFTPLEMIALLALYLIEYRQESGVIACTNANTQYLGKIAEANGLPYVNKPVGFKYIAEVMQKQDLLIGGEESGGLTVKGYLPERDGVLINLLLLEMVVKTGKTTLQLLQDLYARFGEFHFRRRDFPVAPSKGKRQVAAISKTPPDSIAGIAVTSVDTLDGAKLFFQDGSWLLFRQSGTEPSLRVYTEAPSLEACDRLIEMGMKALGEADPHK
jgi:phosphomannomutase